MKVIVQQEQPNRVIPRSDVVIVKVQPKEQNKVVVIGPAELDNNLRAKMYSVKAVTPINVANAGALMADQDLSDVDSASTARINLELEIGVDVQAHDTVLDGTTASFTTTDKTKIDGIEALADVTDATNVTAAGALIATNDLSDLDDASTARTNLDLDEIYTKKSIIEATTASFTTTDETKLDAIDVDTDGNVLMVGTLMSANNLSDLANASTARTNLDLDEIYTKKSIIEATTASFTTTDETKLNAIEALADVTDTANVTSAGALMDSELASIADVKSLNQAVDSNASPVLRTTNFTDATDKRLMTDAQETKLDSVESSADVTDATNVTAAGAVMTSNNLSDVTASTARTNLDLDEIYTKKSIIEATTASFTTVDETKLDAIDVDTDGNVLMVGTLMSASNLSDVADASTSRINLELEIGVDVQAHSAVLDATTSAFLTADKTKIDGIEALADVTDATNVTTAGALMDSELASIADVKALDQSVISGATPTFTTTNFTDATNKRLMTDAQETKLDSVESSADVTDTLNVTSAGALMADNNLADIGLANEARENLGLDIGSDVQAYSSILDGTTASFTTTDETKLDAIDVDTDGNVLMVGTLMSANNLSDVDSSSTARTNLDLEIGVDVQAYSSILDGTTASFTTTDETKLDAIDLDTDGNVLLDNFGVSGVATFNDIKVDDIEFVGPVSTITCTDEDGILSINAQTVYVGTMIPGDIISYGTYSGEVDATSLNASAWTTLNYLNVSNISTFDKTVTFNDIEFGGPSSTITCTDTDGILLIDTGVDFLENEVVKPKLKEYSETHYTQTFGSEETTIDLANGNIQTLAHGVSVISPYPITLTGANSTSNSVSTVTLILTGGWGSISFRSDNTDNTEAKWAGGVSPRIGGGGSGGTDIVTLITTDGGDTWYGMSGGMNFS